MKELVNRDPEVKEEQREDELYSIPDEACCSPEFPEGCILLD